jgi:hypothetical protein
LISHDSSIIFPQLSYNISYLNSSFFILPFQFILAEQLRFFITFITFTFLHVSKNQPKTLLTFLHVSKKSTKKNLNLFVLMHAFSSSQILKSCFPFSIFIFLLNSSYFSLLSQLLPYLRIQNFYTLPSHIRI